MARISKTILKYLDERRMVFVFPSAVAAESRAREACGDGGQAVDMRRFIAWDRFKAAVFSPGIPGKIPADRALRRLFSLSVLRDNSENSFLSTIVRPEFRERYGKFAGMVERALPSLGCLPSATAAAPLSGELADWAEISRRYDSFLERYDYFEPSRNALRPIPGECRYCIFYPELIEDFAMYRYSLEASPETFFLVSGRLEASPELRCFDAAATEIRFVLSRISLLLDSGVHPSAVAVTVPDWPAWRPYFEREAALYGIPLSVKAGKPLSEWTAGKFFRALGRCVSDNWSFAALKALALDGAWPFKKAERDRAFNFLRCGTAYHAVAPWTEDGKKIDLWEKTFTNVSGTPGLDVRDALAFYRSVRKNAEEIRFAPSFRAIADKFGRFENVLFDRDGWGPNGKVVERALVVLTELALTEERIGLHPEIDRFQAFLDYLDSVPYVYKTSETGVAVYPWRVSAGVAAGHRFVMNASQGAVTVRYSGFGFLSPHVAAGLSGGDTDATLAFIGAYAETPVGAADTVFTFSSKGPDGERVPHAVFFPGKVFMTAGNEDYDRFKIMDNLSAERAAWSGGTSDPASSPCALPFQSAAWNARVDPEAGRGWIAGSSGIEDRETRDGIASLARDGDGFLKASDTFVETWIQCPFKCLIEQVLRFPEIMSGIDFADSLFIGSTIHEVARAVFDKIAGYSGSFDPGKIAEYNEFILPSVSAAIDELSGRSGAFLKPVLECFEPEFERMMRGLLESEAELRPGWDIVGVEMKHSRVYAEEKIRLTGMIDRVSGKDGVLFVVDYKKGLPSIPSILPFREALSSIADALSRDGELPVFQKKPFQLPAYAELIDPGPDTVFVAGYWACTERKSRIFIDTSDGSEKKALGPEGLSEARAAFRTLMFAAGRGVEAGGYRVNSRKRERACSGCGLRAVCRTGYSI